MDINFLDDTLWLITAVSEKNLITEEDLPVKTSFNKSKRNPIQIGFRLAILEQFEQPEDDLFFGKNTQRIFDSGIGISCPRIISEISSV